MKKNFLNLLLVISILAALITTLPFTASAASSGTCGENLTWTLDENGTLTISGTGEMYDYDTYQNTPPWRYIGLVKTVNIQEGVTRIGDFAFTSMRELTSINVDSNNKVYASVDGVLYDKSKTRLICYPGGKVGEYIIPNNTTHIERNAFFYCPNLTAITIPDSVTDIGYDAFHSSGLTSVTIPDSVTNIEDWAFGYCSDLTNVTIGTGVTRIGQSVFNSCSSLTEITIPVSVTSIGNFAFDSCTSLTEITIPVSVTSIENYAFNSCDNLRNVYYDGTIEQWENINIGEWGNEYLTAANIIYKGNTASFGTAFCVYDGSKVTVNVKFGYLIQDGILFAAVYDKEGILKALNMSPVTANDLDYTLEFDADESYKDYNVELFCWDSSTSLKPLSNAYKTAITEGEFIDEVLESAHPYNDNADEINTYTYDGVCESIDVTFSEDTCVEEGFDYIYIYDGNDTLIGEYTGNTLAGATVHVPGNTVKIRLTSDGSVNEYGYKTKSIVVSK